MIRAITAPRWRRLSKSRAGQVFPLGARKRQTAASCAASASSRISRIAVWHPPGSRVSLAHAVACSKAPMSGSILQATSPFSPARIITAKAMRPCLPRSSATCSAYRAVSSRSSTATPRAAPSVSAPMVHARPRSAAVPSPKRSAKSSTKAERPPATCSRPASRTSNSPPASSPSVAPTMTFGEVAGAAYFPPDGFPLDIL
jgi:hypothetical protein